MTCTGDFAAGVYKSLEDGDTVSHIGIFLTRFVNCCPSNLLSGSTPPPPFLVWISTCLSLCGPGRHDAGAQFRYLPVPTYWGILVG
jgi:hypothetical protein